MLRVSDMVRFPGTVTRGSVMSHLAGKYEEVGRMLGTMIRCLLPIAQQKLAQEGLPTEAQQKLAQEGLPFDLSRRNNMKTDLSRRSIPPEAEAHLAQGSPLIYPDLRSSRYPNG